jgi:hypothetical protein
MELLKGKDSILIIYFFYGLFNGLKKFFFVYGINYQYILVPNMFFGLKTSSLYS